MQRQKFTHGFEIRLSEDSKLEENSQPHFQYVHYVKPPARHAVSFKGGGRRIFVYEAFIKTAQQRGLFSSVKQVGGSSSGVIPAIVSAIHFTDAAHLQNMLDTIFNADPMDLVGDSSVAKIYDGISSIIYKPFTLVGDGFNWCGKKLSWAGVPLRLSAALIDFAGGIISTRGLVGLYNLIIHKGIYSGRKLQAVFRDQIQKYVQLGVNDILNKIQDSARRYQIIQHLIDIHLGEFQNERFIVFPDVNFFHFAELARLPGSQFKELYMTGVKIKKEEGDQQANLEEVKRKKLIVFNADDPVTQMIPIHEAARGALAFPQIYQPATLNGVQFFDGGTLDNSPVRLAKEYKVSPIQAKYGVTDRTARLQVRVEYPKDLKELLWKQPPEKRRVGKLITAVMQFFSYDIDSREAEAESVRSMQNDFPQTTLQMDDFGLSRFANVSANQRLKYVEESQQGVTDYFDNHEMEMAVIQHFRRPMADDVADEKIPAREPQIMPIDLQLELLALLENRKDFPTQDIFYIPNRHAGNDLPNKNFSSQELSILEQIRDDEILRIRSLPAVIARLEEVTKSELALSTSLIFDILNNGLSNGLSAGPVCHPGTSNDAEAQTNVGLIVNEPSSAPSVTQPHHRSMARLGGR